MEPLGGGNKKNLYIGLGNQRKNIMANFWNVPKSLMRSREVSANGKLILSIALQYFNAGYPEKLTIPQLCKVVGASERRINSRLGKLIAKGFIKQNSEFVELNHIELIKNKLFDPTNYKNFEKAMS